MQALERRRFLSAVIYVDANLQGGTGDGSSWANAYTHLAPALAAAQMSDTVEVADGAYLASLEGTFTLKSGVTVRGGGTRG